MRPPHFVVKRGQVSLGLTWPLFFSQETHWPAYEAGGLGGARAARFAG